MSNADGWPGYEVVVEHQPNRTMQLWLRDGAGQQSLGTIDSVIGLYPIVKRRVADKLGLVGSEFYVEVHVPRPSYIKNGVRVRVLNEQGRAVDAVIKDWIDSSVYLTPVDEEAGGGGFYAPDALIFDSDD